MGDELEQRAADYISSVLGFNGERLDPVLGGYHLGNGYRLYSPALRRFTSPDSMSPFGRGGINPYVYCEGDPINNTDPSGHFGIFGAIINVGMFAADLFTDGAASAAEETGVLLAREDESIAVREAGRPRSNAIRSGEEAANIDKYEKPYPSQRELGRANFKLFRPSTEALADKWRHNELKDLDSLMGSTGGYTDSFNGTGEPGLITHGVPGFMEYVNKDGGIERLDPITALKQLEKDYGLKLFIKTDTPLHILACGTSSPALGTSLAGALERPVVLYGTGNQTVRANVRSSLSGIYKEIKGISDGPHLPRIDLPNAIERTYFPKF